MMGLARRSWVKLNGRALNVHGGRLPLIDRMGAAADDMLVGDIREKTGKVSMSKADEDAIRAIEVRFNEAWGRHDPDGMIESLTDDAEFVTVNGAWTKNRAGFRDLMVRLHGPTGPFRKST